MPCENCACPEPELDDWAALRAATQRIQQEDITITPVELDL